MGGPESFADAGVALVVVLQEVICELREFSSYVVPAKAGTQRRGAPVGRQSPWVPAFAGTTSRIHAPDACDDTNNLLGLHSYSRLSNGEDAPDGVGVLGTVLV